MEEETKSRIEQLRQRVRTVKGRLVLNLSNFPKN